MAGCAAFGRAALDCARYQMTDYIKTLEKLREQMVDARRDRAAEFLKNFSAHAAFVESQTIIDLLDKAIEDERKLTPVKPVKGFSKLADSYTTEPPDDDYRGYR
jgi:cobalamin biosynthesis Co2+ chelatase CbiK